MFLYRVQNFCDIIVKIDGFLNTFSVGIIKKPFLDTFILAVYQGMVLNFLGKNFYFTGILFCFFIIANSYGKDLACIFWLFT